MLESIRERSALLRIAPDLVEPLPVLVATHRGVSRGRLAHGMALALNDLVSWRRNRGLAPGRVIPRGRLTSRQECLRLFPGFSSKELTGGALWYDARLRHPERLTLSFLQSAARRGCLPVNYVEVNRLRVHQGAVEGATATDRLSGRQLDVRSRMVVVAAGPWTHDLITDSLPRPGRPTTRPRALAVNLALGRPLIDLAVGVEARSGAAEDPVCGGHRFLFLTPYGATTLLGTWYAVDDGTNPRALRERGVRTLLREFSDACPGLGLSPSDVVRSQCGWLPLKDGFEPGRATALAERPRIESQAGPNPVRRLLWVEGVKYTTARRVAERVVNQVFRDLGLTSPPCRTSEVRLDVRGGESLDWGGTVAGAEIKYAVQEEMALKLGDIVFRRSHLGALPGVSRATVEEVGRVAGAELGWDASRQEAEVEDVMRRLGAQWPAAEAVG